MSEIRETGFENAKIGDRVFYPLLASVKKDDKTNACIEEINPVKVYRGKWHKDYLEAIKLRYQKGEIDGKNE